MATRHAYPRFISILLWPILLCWLLPVLPSFAQTAAFTYQGRLADAGSPANGDYDLQFKLFDTPNIGTGMQHGATLTRNPVAVSAGAFAVTLDFGAGVFNGTERYLEIGVRPSGSGNPYTVLAPRQAITSAPYAIRSLAASTAETAINSSQLGGVGAVRFVQSDAMGSVSIAGNLTVLGTVTYDTVNATTQYNLGGQRVLSNAGADNLFVGIGTGAANTTGRQNSFFGASAGLNNRASFNSFIGFAAGQDNTTGCCNSFFGNAAGINNTTGSHNSFFGNSAGVQSLAGSNNSFFGSFAGQLNKADNNSFFGAAAGLINTTGTNNSFFGKDAGVNNTTASDNSFLGSEAGLSNQTGTNNAFFGRRAGYANTSGNNAFFGAFAGQANTSGSFNAFFGAVTGSSNTTGSYNAFFGTSAGVKSNGGESNTLIGTFAGQENVSGGFNTLVGTSAGLNTITSRNTFVGAYTGNNTTTGGSNTFFGALTGQANTTGNSNTLIGSFANAGTTNLNFATAVGSNAIVSTNDTIVLGKVAGIYDSVARPADTVQIPGNLNVAGSFAVPSNNITGVLAMANGGTGLSAAGATGNFLRSNGMVWTSSPIQASDIPNLSGSFIQNSTTPQPSSNFNISGTGAANAFNATTQFNLTGFLTPGGVIATAPRRVFAEFVGDAGNEPTNLFVGTETGLSNVIGDYNTFVGVQAGKLNNDGNRNSFFGARSGQANTSGVNNSFFGNLAGSANATGAGNVLVGKFAGATNVQGSSNTVIGSDADVGEDNLINAAAIGARAQVTQNDSLVLGSINGVNNATADTKVGIGTTAPKARLDVTGGNLLIGSSGQGIILKSPNGATCRLLAIDNAGGMVLTAVACP